MNRTDPSVTTVREWLADWEEPDTADILALDDYYSRGYCHSVTVLTQADIEALKAGKVLALNAMDEYTVFVTLADHSGDFGHTDDGTEIPPP